MNDHEHFHFGRRDLLKTAAGVSLLSSTTLAVDEDANESSIEAYPDRLSYLIC